jgi:hypothetical protein
LHAGGWECCLPSWYSYGQHTGSLLAGLLRPWTLDIGMGRRSLRWAFRKCQRWAKTVPISSRGGSKGVPFIKAVVKNAHCFRGIANRFWGELLDKPSTKEINTYPVCTLFLPTLVIEVLSKKVEPRALYGQHASEPKCVCNAAFFHHPRLPHKPRASQSELGHLSICPLHMLCYFYRGQLTTTGKIVQSGVAIDFKFL